MARDPARIPGVLHELGTYWAEHPDLRLGQIVANLARAARQDPYYIEDETLVAAAGLEKPAPSENKERFRSGAPL